MQNPLILVEGGDDAYFLQHFLRLACQFQYAVNTAIISQGTIDKLLKRIAALDGDSNPVIAIICDADSDPEARWRELRKGIGHLHLRETPESGGSIVRLSRQRQAGVWMMPDNQGPGSLETFLATIRSTAAPQPELWKKSIGTVASIEHRLFADKDSAKAELRTWLAWQKEPGASPGLAVAMDCFDLTHPLAVSLADWFRRLLPTPAVP